MQSNIHYSPFNFVDVESAPFKAQDYSLLKFGNKKVAREFGYRLAQMFFDEHADLILTEKLIVIPSPYNYVKNAATMLAKNFYHALNRLVVNAKGNQLEYGIIQRKVSYTFDYGTLPKEKRKGLLDNDQFYINSEFMKDKTIIFIDDVRITGTHEDKLRDILRTSGLDKRGHFFLYFANYVGERAEIESELNFAYPVNEGHIIQQLNNGESELLIRPIKYLMKLEPAPFKEAISKLRDAEKLYDSCLAEGYHKIPAYQPNIVALKEFLYA